MTVIEQDRKTGKWSIINRWCVGLIEPMVGKIRGTKPIYQDFVIESGFDSRESALDSIARDEAEMDAYEAEMKERLAKEDKQNV